MTDLAALAENGREVTETFGRDSLSGWDLLARIQQRLRWRFVQLRHRELRAQPYVALEKYGQISVFRDGQIEVGTGCHLSAGYFVGVRGALTIGEGLFANSYFHISCMLRVSIGSDVRCGERVSIHDENHVVAPAGRAAAVDSYVCEPVHIGDNVWLGAGTVVLAGARIGDNTVIGANSVVRGSIPPGVLAAGSPATVLRRLGQPAATH